MIDYRSVLNCKAISGQEPNIAGDVGVDTMPTESAVPSVGREQTEARSTDFSVVKRRFFLRGSVYSRNKVAIKELFKEHGLKWKGTLDFPQWMNSEHRIRAEFIRENEVTTGAIIRYDGVATSDFCIALTRLLESFGAEYTDDEEQRPSVSDDKLEELIAEDLRIWDVCHRPNVELLRKGSIHNGYQPVPEPFINAALADWKERREVEKARLIAAKKEQLG